MPPPIFPGRGAAPTRPGPSASTVHMASPLPHLRLPGPPTPARRVVLLHGVGLGSETLAESARLLSRDHDVVVPDRRGYGAAAAWPPAEALTDHLDDLLALLDRLGWEQADVVGVSGGATLALALAARDPGRLSGLVAHEPLVGPRAPELDATVQDRSATLAADSSPAAVAVFVSQLVGVRTWNALPAAWRELVVAREAAVRREIPQFARFAPRPDDLADWRALGRPAVTTLGATSAPARGPAAQVAADLIGGRVQVIPGVGHLAPVDDPSAFAAALELALDPVRAATEVSCR